MRVRTIAFGLTAAGLATVTLLGASRTVQQRIDAQRHGLGQHRRHPAGNAFTGLLDPDLAAHPDPAPSYADAEARVRAVLDAEASLDLIDDGHSIARLTGTRTPTAVVMFHGYTAAPGQFRLLAEGYHAAGCNVWVPRLPFHGETDALTSAPSGLTGPLLRDFADAALDLAAGLGDEVLVIGLSGGGSLALWSAVARREVDRAVLISPLLLPLGYHAWQMTWLVRAVRWMPTDRYLWWDATVRDTAPRSLGYPRFSLKGMAALLSLTEWADAHRRDATSRASVLLIRNDGDPQLDSAYNESFVTRLVGPGRLTVYRIPAADGLPHDIVGTDPLGDNHATARASYAHLSAALGVPLPDPSRAPAPSG